jgi:hypothetical protein
MLFAFLSFLSGLGGITMIKLSIFITKFNSTSGTVGWSGFSTQNLMNRSEFIVGEKQFVTRTFIYTI